MEDLSGGAREATTTGADGDISLRTVSVVEAAADALRSMVLDGRLDPGARLRENEFSQRLGVARHTFRAATQILIGEGLLRRSPNRGVHLAVLTAADIADVFRLRTILEVGAVHLIIDRGTAEPGLELAVERLEGLPADTPWRKVVDADLAFHRAIIDAARSERISRAYASVEAEIQLCMVQLRPFYDRLSVLALEHREMHDPIAAGGLELAEARLRTHLDGAARMLMEAARAREESAE